MKKYRHRKTGEIATYKDGVLKSSGFCVEIGVEPSNEFWEEVKDTYPIGTEVKDTWTGSVYKKKTEEEWIISDGSPKYYIDESKIGEDKRFTLVEKSEKDYEILSFINKGNDSLFHKAKDGKYSASMKVTNGTFEEKELLSKPHFRIYSVRRLSDNEVFTIGGDVFFGKNGKIKSISIVSGKCYIDGDYGNQGRGFGCVLSSISKSSPILFTTEDGVDVRKDDVIYTVEVSPFLVPRVSLVGVFPDTKKLFSRHIFFHSKERAEQYIIWNIPKLSALEVFEFATFNKEGNLLLDVELLKQLAKSKIK